MNPTLIPVSGGDLTVFCSGPKPADARGIVLLIHGITASAPFMAPIADALAQDLFVINVDLRGRGGSACLPGPAGMRSHVDDMASVLRHFGIEDCVVVGHSMGAYVATMFAHRHPCPTKGLVLVDGGFPISLPEGLEPQEILDQLLGPALARFEMSFSSVDEYIEFYKGHPSLAEGNWNSYVEQYVRYDLGPNLKPTGNVQLIIEDGTETLLDQEVRTAASGLTLPIELIRAGKGLLNQPGGLIPTETAKQAAEQPNITLTNFETINHYMIVFSPTGANAIAEATERLLS